VVVGQLVNDTESLSDDFPVPSLPVSRLMSDKKVPDRNNNGKRHSDTAVDSSKRSRIDPEVSVLSVLNNSDASNRRVKQSSEVSTENSANSATVKCNILVRGEATSKDSLLSIQPSQKRHEVKVEKNLEDMFSQVDSVDKVPKSQAFVARRGRGSASDSLLSLL
jgi:hypothetical protein